MFERVRRGLDRLPSPLRLGALLGTLLVGVVTLESLDAARDMLGAISAQGGDGDENAPRYLVPAWLVAGALSVAAAGFLSVRVLGAVPPEERRRALVVTVATTACLAFWAAFGAFGGPRAETHLLLLGLAATTLLIVAPSLTGNIRDGWGRASVVRVHMLLLLGIYVLFFMVGLTGDQTAEVLRGWGDDAWVDVCVGVAGALLLGLTIRASSRRLFTQAESTTTQATPDPAPPTGGRESTWNPDTHGGTHTRADTAFTLGVAGGAAVLALVLCLLHFWAGAFAAAVVAAAIVSSKPNTLTTKDTVLSTSSARLSDTLGLVPPIILTAGLLVATVESWLWTGSEARTWLTVVTAGVVVLLAVLAGRAHSAPEADRRRSQEQAPADPDPHVTPTAISRVKQFLPEATAAGVGAGLCLLATNAHQTIALAAAIVLLAMTVALALHLDGDGSPLVLSFAAGAASGTVVGIHLAPVTGAGAIGVLACVFLVLSGIVVILHGLAAWSAGRNLRAASWMKPWPRHVPLVALIGIWVLVAFATVPTTVHQVRTVERTAATTPPMVDAAVREWLGKTSGADDGSTPRPMLLVGASGGGTKAAYWTTLILDCLVGGEMPAGDTECGESDDRQGPERLQRLFLTSSVSGGSVGVLHFVSHLTHDPDLAVEWIETRVGREVLSPLTAWGLVHDLPIFLLGWPTDPNRCAGGEGSCAIHADRALVQEAAIGNYGNALRTNPGPGIRTANTGGPRTIFNGALDGSVGRILISPLDLAPVYPESEACRAQDGRLRPVTGALDAADVLADDRDLPLVSAALLSARFPMLEPPGRVGTEAGKDLRGCEAVPRTAVRVRDGGYVENTGLLTIAELLPTIRATLDAEGAERMPIIVLSIDDDSAIADPNPELEEPAANPLTVASRVSSGYLTRKARDTLSSCQVDGVYSLRVSPPPHVGAHAATGWEISETARRLDLGRAASTGDVLRQINELRGMLDGTRPVPVC